VQELQRGGQFIDRPADEYVAARVAGFDGGRLRLCLFLLGAIDVRQLA